jgi:hypothetical protein
MSASPRRLPEQPNLEQLRKQAKELLQEFRAGVPSAMAEVNQFERMPTATDSPSAMPNGSLRALTALPVGPN